LSAAGVVIGSGKVRFAADDRPALDSVSSPIMPHIRPSAVEATGDGRRASGRAKRQPCAWAARPRRFGYIR
jgi:hypothetical protein